MAHEAKRIIAERINNKPLLITEDALTPILDYLETREEAAIGNEDTKRRNAPSIAERTAIIPISGSLSYQKTWMGALCGMTSYQQLLEDVEEMIDLGAKTIVMDISSGGGEAYGAFSTATSIKKRTSEAGVKLLAYVDGMAASAAYALAAVADEIIINPMAEAGSIGVLVRLMDSSEAMKKAGYKPIFITSAESKVPFNAQGGFKKEFLEEIQERVDKLHMQFVEHVASYRNISPESVNDMQAKVFDADKALSLGLVDKVMEHEDFFEYLAQLEDVSTPMNVTNFLKPKAKATDSVVVASIDEESEAMKLAELQAQYEELSAKLEASVDQIANMESSILQAQAAVEGKEAELQTALSELNEIKAAKAQELADAKLAKLAAVFGDDQATELFESMSALPDAAFDKIVDAQRKANVALTDSPMMKEVGVSVEAAVVQEPKTQQQLVAEKIQAKYAK